MGLTDKQKRFVVEYVVDYNGTQAAIRAGYSPDGAGQQAVQLLSNPAVVAEINERIREIASSKALTVEWVLQQWRDIATADPTEVIYIRVDACRHCWGTNHAYQWTEFEYQQRLEKCRAHICRAKCDQPCTERIPPMALGGFGFDPRKGPAAECPVCAGDGVSHLVINDMKKLTGPARKLIASVKQTQHGIEVKFRDQDGALKNIADYLGMLVKRSELAGPGGGPIPIANVSAKDLTDDQIATALAQRKVV